MKKEEIIVEVTEITGKTLLSLIPVGGTLVTCVWDSIKSHTAQKRMQEWQEMIADRLCTLEKTVDELGSNELFSSSMMRATEIAIKTAEKEKLEYLANAIRNSIEMDVNESILMIYIHMIDEYTVWHIKILDYFNNPKKYVVNCNYSMGSAMMPLLEVYSEMSAYKELIEKIVYDLQNSGLLTKGNYLHASMTTNGMIEKRTTKFGEDFLKYIVNIEEE